MPSHRSHGRGYVEAPRHDELPEGVTALAPTGGQHRSNGTVAPGCTDLASRGGAASKGKTQLSHNITGAKLSTRSVRRARTLRRALAREIATSVGGGYCGIAASLFIKF